MRMVGNMLNERIGRAIAFQLRVTGQALLKPN